MHQNVHSQANICKYGHVLILREIFPSYVLFSIFFILHLKTPGILASLNTTNPDMNLPH